MLITCQPFNISQLMHNIAQYRTTKNPPNSGRVMVLEAISCGGLVGEGMLIVLIIINHLEQFVYSTTTYRRRFQTTKKDRCVLDSVESRGMEPNDAQRSFS